VKEPVHSLLKALEALVSDHAASSDGSLAAQLARQTGLNVAACYQCGKCSAGCPMAEEMPLKPHQMLRLAQLDLSEKLLADESLWLCLTCETCTARCPNEVDPARIIDGLRELALRKEPASAPRRIIALHRSMLEQIESHGRVFELGAIVAYKLRTGTYFNDALSAPGMYLRGKLALLPKSIEGRDEVRRIFEACRSHGKETP
jgi:heterodisulfide reductase subunit C2